MGDDVRDSNPTKTEAQFRPEGFGDRLYSYQKLIVNDHSNRRIINKARQIGVSFIITFEGFLKAWRNKSLILYLSASQRQSLELMKYINNFCNLYNIKTETERNDEIKLSHNGSVILSLPCTSSTIRGFPATDIYLDEFAHYQHDRDVFQAIVPGLTRTDVNRTLTVVSTPLGKRGLFHDIWENNNVYSKHKVDVNDAIKGGCPISLETCRALVPDDIAFRQEYLCEFVDDAISFFPYELLQQCWNDELENATFDQLRVSKYPLYAGYDPAKVIDSGVFTIVEHTPDKVILRHRKEWRQVAYTEQLAYIEHYCKGTSVTKLITDQTGVGQKIQEDLQRSLGSSAEGVTFTTPTKEKMITDLRVLFQDKRITIPYDMNLVNELHSLERTITSSGNVRYRHEEGKHDDSVWSLAMACYGFNQYPPVNLPLVSPLLNKGLNYLGGLRQYERSNY